MVAAVLACLWTLLGALAGAALGFVPGLYLGLAAALYHGLVGFTPEQALGVAAAVGANVYTKRLGATFSPAAGSPDLASMDVALKLSSQGKGLMAISVSTQVIDRVLAYAFVALVVIAVAACFGIDIKAWVQWVAAPIALLGALMWTLSVAWRSRKVPLKAAAVILTGGALGYALTHHAAMTGDVHALAPLLLGAFAFPIAGTLLLKGGQLPKQEALDKEPEVDTDNVFLGSLFGVMGGVAVGVGASSLASTVEGFFDAEGQEGPLGFLTVAVAAETVNDLVALFLLAFTGAGRSGEAVAIANITGQLNVLQGVTILVAAFVGLLVGAVFTKALASEAADICGHRYLGLAVGLGLGIVQLLSTNNIVVALCFTVCFFIWAWVQKKWRVPSQALFSPFIGTAWVHSLGETANRALLGTTR